MSVCLCVCVSLSLSLFLSERLCMCEHAIVSVCLPLCVCIYMNACVAIRMCVFVYVSTVYIVHTEDEWSTKVNTSDSLLSLIYFRDSSHCDEPLVIRCEYIQQLIVTVSHVSFVCLYVRNLLQMILQNDYTKNSWAVVVWGGGGGVCLFVSAKWYLIINYIC